MAKPKKTEDREVDPVLSLALKRFKRCEEHVSDSRDLQRDDLKFAAASPDNGWQWPENIRRSRDVDARPCLTINKLPQHIRQVTNEQRQNKPSVKVRPVDDSGDPEVAEVFNGIVRHVEAISDADIAYETAGDHQVTHGEGFIGVITDYCDDESFDQDIFVRRFRDPFKVFLDPDAQQPDGSDARFAFVIEELEKDEFKQLYPDHEPADWDGAKKDCPDWFNGDYVRIAEYWTREESSDEVEKGGRKRKKTTYKVKCRKLTGFSVIEEKEWAGKWIPIARVVGNEWVVDGDIIVSGIVRNAKDPQRMYNYWTSQEAEILALAPKAPFVGAAGQFEGYEDRWEQANTRNFAYLEYNPIVEQGIALPAPQRQAPPMPPAGILQAKMGASEDLKTTTGQYDASLGARSNEQSGKAIMARQREGDMSTYHYLDNLARAIRHIGRILVDLIPKIYDTPRVARIIGEDDSFEIARIDPTIAQPMVKKRGLDGSIERIYNLGVGKYDVVVTVGPNFTTKRQESAEAMAQILQGNPQLWQLIGDVFVKSQDWPGSDEMAKRLKAVLPPEVRQVIDADDDEASPEMMQMQQQMQMFQQQLQQMQQAAAEEIGKREAEIERLKSGEQIKVAELGLKEREVGIKEREVGIKEAEAIAKLQAQPEPGAEDMQVVMNVPPELQAAVQEMQGMAQMVAQQQQQIAQLAEAVIQTGQMNAQAVTEMAQTLAAAVSKPRKRSMMLDGQVIEAVDSPVEEQ